MALMPGGRGGSAFRVKGAPWRAVCGCLWDISELAHPKVAASPRLSYNSSPSATVSHQLMREL